MAQKQQKRKGKAISEFLPLSVEFPSWKPTLMKTQLSSTSDAIPIGVNSRGSSVRVLQACSLVIYDFSFKGDCKKCAVAHGPEIVNTELEN